MPIPRSAIQEHYDQLNAAYTRLWGEHIHHGYWARGDESPIEAQVRLVEELVAMAGVPVGGRVVDIGCGVGGTAFWLADHRRCRVVGISISGAQLRHALARRASRPVIFVQADGMRLPLRCGSADMVWVVECSEHMPDKAAFLRECARVLCPGGRLALAAWLAGEALSPDRQRLVQQVCEGCLLPSLETAAAYLTGMRAAGLTSCAWRDATEAVRRTWDVCLEIVSRPWVRAALALQPPAVRRFVHTFPLLRQAYATGAMRYGFFAARKET